MDHRAIVEPTLKRLPQEQAAYFYKIVDTVAKDPRTDAIGNKLYLTLKETISVLPIYLPEQEFIDLLFRFVDKHSTHIDKIIYSAEFVVSPTALKQITNVFVQAVVDATMIHYDKGTIDTGEQTFHRVSWPYYDDSFPYIDDDDVEDEDD